MRVFCHEHKKSFFAPRQSPIKCENRGHSLGELDFDGSSSVPVNLEWQYCCNCEHFCPINFSQDGLETCPVCTRRSSVLYICDKCYTVSFESNTALQIKNFTLNKDGAPQPSCPGCLQETVSDLHEHACDDAKTTFVTGLNSCPICHERLDIGPSFPSLVTDYLKRTRAAHKTNVTFDYDSGLFVPVNDGEFVLIHGSDAGKLMILPRASRFESKRDFYEFYQDYYHCANPLNGAVQIIEPAEVESIADGFALRKSGVLEVVADAPKRASAPNPANVPKPASPAKPASAANPASPPKSASPAKPANARRQETNPVVESVPQAPSVETPKEEPGVILCTFCESMIETKYKFCWKCGSRLDSKSGFGS